MKCRICNSHSNLFGQATILQKYRVAYYECGNCGFIQTEEPFWLEEAYSSAMTKSDIGLIGRNLGLADLTQKVVLSCLDPQAKFIDYGGGYGIFVRIMRDRGFDFYRLDPLCENLFAEHFDAPKGAHFNLLTAWEVFEHLENPMEKIEEMLSMSPVLLFSTALLPSPPKNLEAWWYYGLEHGQHIAFYSRETIRHISQKFDLRIHYSSENIHFLGRPEINPFRIRAAFDPRLTLLRKLLSKPQPASLLERDFELITGKRLS
ncbi:MAG: class I SAM-dependent methyltransferase [Chloroflexota bacterium]